MVRSKNIVIYSIFGAQRLPQFFEVELCSKDCDKQNVDFGCSLAIFCDWLYTFLIPDERWQKTEQQNERFLNLGARTEKIWKILSKHWVFMGFWDWNITTP